MPPDRSSNLPDDPHDAHQADLSGLPVRGESAGRDRLEEIASAYLEAARRGQPLEIEDCIRAHPDIADELREFLPLVVAMESWKAQQDLRVVQQPLPDHFEIRELGGCRIIREIARGGMGVVFEAEQIDLGRRVAIKLLPWRIPKRSRWAEQFIREARTTAQLKHQHIVPVFSFGEQEERYFYIMQLIHGVGLDQVISRWRSQSGNVDLDQLIREYHPQPASLSATRRPRWLRHDSMLQLCRIAAQIVAGLRSAHQQGVLHRDIKPGNLLIDHSGKIWITDFGLALAQEKLLADQQATLAGTLRYMAPEQFVGPGDARSDVYSLGVTLYELFTLQPAFAGNSRRELMERIEQGAAPAPRSILRDIPRPVEALIRRAMARKPEDRFASLDALQAELLEFLNSLTRRAAWRRMMRRWF